MLPFVGWGCVLLHCPVVILSGVVPRFHLALLGAASQFDYAQNDTYGVRHNAVETRAVKRSDLGVGLMDAGGCTAALRGFSPGRGSRRRRVVRGRQRVAVRGSGIAGSNGSLREGAGFCEAKD